MKNVLLISNWHVTHTRALVRDFAALGFDIYLPKDNFDDRIKYFFSNEILLDEPNTRLCDYWEFAGLQDVRKWVLCGCTEQMDDFQRLANVFGATLIYTVSKNNAEYPHGTSDYLLSPDVQTFDNYPAKHKMLYFYPPHVYWQEKDLLASYKSGLVASYIHNYAQYWPESYGYATEFERAYSRKVQFYGAGTRDGELTHREVHQKMVQSMFTLYFKEKESYGSMVLESMLLGTPVIALDRYIQDKTVGKHFLNDYNSIIVSRPEEAISKIRNLSYDQYQRLSDNAIATVLKLTDNEARLKKLDYLLKQ